MPNFSHLAKYEVPGTVARPYKINDLDPAPTIYLKPATEDNVEYWNETLRVINERNSSGSAKKRLTPGSVLDSRDEDRVRLAQYCATGWDEKVTDSEGQPVPFTVENCIEYFRALPSWIFDGIRQFAVDPGNFAARPTGEKLGES